MPCEVVRTKDVTAIVCGRGGGRGKKCFAAPEHYGAHWLCDFPTGEGKTCDRPVCDRHRRRVGKDKDYCLEHWVAAGRPGPA